MKNTELPFKRGMDATLAMDYSQANRKGAKVEVLDCRHSKRFGTGIGVSVLLLGRSGPTWMDAMWFKEYQDTLPKPKAKRKGKLKRYACSYAYDIPAYADFTVKARGKGEALQIIRKALKDGRFEHVECSTNFDNTPENKRVFVMGEATKDCSHDTMEELIAASQPKGESEE